MALGASARRRHRCLTLFVCLLFVIYRAYKDVQLDEESQNDNDLNQKIELKFDEDGKLIKKQKSFLSQIFGGKKSKNKNLDPSDPNFNDLNLADLSDSDFELPPEAKEPVYQPVINAVILLRIFQDDPHQWTKKDVKDWIFHTLFREALKIIIDANCFNFTPPPLDGKKLTNDTLS